MELSGIKAVVVGLAESGAAAAAFLARRGAGVVGTDILTEAELGPEAVELRKEGVALELGGHRLESFLKADLVVLSPGVPGDIGPVERAREAGAKVIGELELAARFIQKPMVAVTGTNGKTTTVHLIREMLEASGIRALMGGNVSPPLSSLVERQREADWIVAEVSSFQLETIEEFRPRVGCLLNVADDHLDRHRDMDGYTRLKARLFENQTPDDFAVLNLDCPATARLAGGIGSAVLGFSRAERKDAAGFISGGEMVFRLEGREEKISLRRFRLKEAHNLENALAAGLCALLSGATPGGVEKALTEFRGLSHRLEPAGEVKGVFFFDDSKATNVAAVVRALESMDRPVVLIAGGRAKDPDMGPLKEPLKKKVRRVVLMGEAAESMAREIAGLVEVETAGFSMERAVGLAFEAARPGDAVLLSPGCASFDMYANYKERGEDFKSRIRRLKGSE